MKWSDPATIHCPECGGDFPVRVAALRSLRAACPGCDASLAAIGKSMLAEEARFRREVDPLLVAFNLEQQASLGISDSELDAIQSLDDLARAIVGRLSPTADREARAAELVADAARRIGRVYLLDEAGADLVRAWLGLGTGEQAEPNAAADGGARIVSGT